MSSPFNIQINMLESLANESILQMPHLRRGSSMCSVQFSCCSGCVIVSVQPLATPGG